MKAFKILLVLAFVGFCEVTSSPPQFTLHSPITKSRRKLQGRFLQITDMHPDPYYTPDASVSSACHRNKPKKEKERAGYYGTPFSDCDSPFILTNFTLNFLAKHWSSEIDFVIWTGDNARHDNDRKLPRTPKEIYDLNRAVANKMEKIFTSRGIPVVPSLGNNDVWPHNIMTPGPNSVTNEFSSIWKPFIPFPSYQIFQRGAYYSVEVIPDKVAVISLNTMYFFDSNKAVGGCEFRDPSDPGNLEFDWLEVQLETFRDRDMQVWISGHVPPSPGNYFPECFVRYVELSLRFQDTILGHLFGHMNADHFFYMEAEDLQLPSEQTANRLQYTSNRRELFEILLRDFRAIPEITNETQYNNYAIINVSPSVVPNPYLPTFRIFCYNITGASRPKISKRKKKGTKRKHGHRHGDHGDKKSQCKKLLYQDSWKCRLNQTWHSDPEAPSRTNRLWSPLGYAQYYLPHLESANETTKPKVRLEYLTFPLSVLRPNRSGIAGPIPMRHLPRSLQNVTITESKYTPYQMDDLTIASWIQLARQVANPDHHKLRKTFRKFMYFGG